MTKQKNLENLKRELLACTKCAIKGVQVMGEGPPNAKIFLVGESPGIQEAKVGRPFVGHAGKILDSLLKKVKIDREDVYITNAVKGIPLINPKIGLKSKNLREPNDEEIAGYKYFLEKEIDIVKPNVIVCLGVTATKSVLDLKGDISLTPFLKVIKFYKNIPVLVTYHPMTTKYGDFYTRAIIWALEKAKES